MTQNRSHAVMQQRAEPCDSLDDFPTPPWAVRALCEQVIVTDSHDDTVWGPACNRGFMVRGLTGYFRQIRASDIHDYGSNALDDFLLPGIRPVSDWIITNPPFRLAAQFAETAIDRAAKGVALLVRTSFLEGIDRYRSLFTVHRPYLIAQFSERVPMVKGRCDPRASTATSYCWIVWTRGKSSEPTEFMWIKPCRRELERPGDYA